jgi:hypothetical protein
MTLPKLIIDTSACSRIATSPNRNAIEAHLDSAFRRVISVPTFWELLQQIEGGDGRHFCNDREVIKVAVGKSRRPHMLPNPLSYAVEQVLKLPRPSAPLPPRVFEQTYALIKKARTREELYDGVPVHYGLRQIRQFSSDIVRQQQEEGEQAHVERLRWIKRKKQPLPPPAEWAKAMLKQVQISPDSKQAAEFADRLDACYHFDAEVWKAVIAPNSKYNPENHRNDWIDQQQTMYLCDPSIHLLTADGGLVKKVSASRQSNRVLSLTPYFGAHGLSL